MWFDGCAWKPMVLAHPADQPVSRTVSRHQPEPELNVRKHVPFSRSTRCVSSTAFGSHAAPQSTLQQHGTLLLKARRCVQKQLVLQIAAPPAVYTAPSSTAEWLIDHLVGRQAGAVMLGAPCGLQGVPQSGISVATCNLHAGHMHGCTVLHTLPYAQLRYMRNRSKRIA